MIKIILDNAQSGGSKLSLVGEDGIVIATCSLDYYPEVDNIILWEIGCTILNTCNHKWEDHGIAAKCSKCGKTNATEKVMALCR